MQSTDHTSEPKKKKKKRTIDKAKAAENRKKAKAKKARDSLSVKGIGSAVIIIIDGGIDRHRGFSQNLAHGDVV